MKWRRLVGRKASKASAPSPQALAGIAQGLAALDSGRDAQPDRARRRLFGNGGDDPGEKNNETKLAELGVDGDMLDALVARIQETLYGQHDVQDERWPRRLQWPSLKYLRASWLYVWEQMQPDAPYYAPGEARIPAANAGHIACLGPCLTQAPTPVHTLIVHGELEYCSLLGHLLHVDLAVCFAAMRTLAHFLKGNGSLRELVFAFTGCPRVVTDESQVPVTHSFARDVLPAFESLLEANERLRYVSFRVSHLRTPRANLRHMCATSVEANCRRRTAFLCGEHPRAVDASPLARHLPHALAKRILDEAFPLPGPSRVDFEFCHLKHSRNRSRFSFLRLGRSQELRAGGQGPRE